MPRLTKPSTLALVCISVAIIGGGGPRTVIAAQDQPKSLYSFSDTELTNAGYKVQYPVSVITLLDGGRDYVYSDSDGHPTVHFPVRPPGFDPRRASPQSLARYNFPPRPQDSTGASNWDRAMTAAATAAAKPMDRLVIAPRLSMPTRGQNSINYASWYDNLIPKKLSSSFSGVVADITEPFAAFNGCTGPIGEAQWVGLGGGINATNGGLVQTGTLTTLTVAGQSQAFPNIYHQPFVEALPAPPMLGPYSANPGDLLLTGVTVTGTAPALYFSYYTQDENQGWSFSGSMSITSAQYDGSTAVWVLERPALDGQPINLMPFSTLAFTQMSETYLTSGSPTSGTPGNIGVDLAYNLMQGQLSDPFLATVDASLTGGNAFNAHWQHCD